jgi:hypothetical protein
MPEAAGYSAVTHLRDGRAVAIRALRPDDRAWQQIDRSTIGLCSRHGSAAWESIWRHRDPRGYVQRQTYAPFTSTRAQPATPAPTTAPPTTARRVVRRATPATLTGVNGRPTLACALSTAIEGLSPGDQLIDARVPKAIVAVANSACLTLIFIIATSCVEWDNDNDWRPARLI